MKNPDPMSFNRLVKDRLSRPVDLKGVAFKSAVSLVRGNRPADELAEPYQALSAVGSDMDGFFLDIIFSDEGDAPKVRKLVCGDLDREAFAARLRQSRKVGKSVLCNWDMADIFATKSFPETYFHPGIAKTLRLMGKLGDHKTAAARIAQTGMVMAECVRKASLPMIYTLSQSHAMRANYNQDTVEYTMLTFSNFGYKHSGLNNEDWFFFWKVFGSMMGLAPGRLHDSYDQSKSALSKLREAFCSGELTDDSKILLHAFARIGYLEKLELDEKDERGKNKKKYVVNLGEVQRCNNLGLISKRMYNYLVNYEEWPKDEKRPARLSFRERQENL